MDYITNMLRDVIKEGNKDKASWGSHWIYMCLGNLKLIKVVNDNYEHIDQLEKLQTLFNGYNSEYEQEYYPYNTQLIKLCYDVVRFTIKSHYSDLKGTETQYHVDIALEIVREFHKTHCK